LYWATFPYGSVVARLSGFSRGAFLSMAISGWLGVVAVEDSTQIRLFGAMFGCPWVGMLLVSDVLRRGDGRSESTPPVRFAGLIVVSWPLWVSAPRFFGH
jgi:hypothetical protein